MLATKVYNPVDRKANLPEVNSDGTSLSAYKIRKHCEGSLRRLQTDWIDLYQMHHIDRDCPWDETWQSFDALVKQGKVVYVGSSNFAAWDIATACQEAAQRGLMGLVSEQSHYHLDNRMVELEVIPACRHYGLGLIPWSPLARGFLVGNRTPEDVTGGRTPRAKSDEYARKLYYRESDFAVVNRLSELAARRGESNAKIGYAWLLHQPGLAAPIVGASKIVHIEEAVSATQIKLSEEEIQHLGDV